jgi:L-malate glycosyltransferase
VKVVYVNHTAQLSGGEMSLLALLSALPAGIDAVVACPRGDLADRCRELGVQVAEIPGTAGSLKLHPVHTPVAVGDMARGAQAVRRVVRAVQPDVVHANSVRAGLICAAARCRDEPPLLVHIRDCLPPGRVSRLTLAALRRHATILVANSAYTARTLNAEHGVRILHSPVDTELYRPGRLTASEARARLGLPADAFVLGVVAQITPWKGQDAAIRALAALHDNHGRDAHLALVGSTKFVHRATRFDNRAYLNDLHRLAERLNVGDRVVFTGERSDIPTVLEALDFLLVPSWEEPFGRSVVEALAMGTPVVATSVGGPAEIIDDGVEGRLLPPREPDLWAGALVELMAAPEVVRDMGRAGRVRAQDFALTRHAAQAVDLYEEVTERRALVHASIAS